ncbi:wax ester/triacylglycerol synthase family O-acyltransferase [Streptomyces sp. NPDC006798]|uniref:wax ester/triacylglycerol synthase family O-acyltransferase n=1 Tax=Streptomyces sp. NPDC006798 TaxID=3155462 RepID=UPI0033FD26D9
MSPSTERLAPLDLAFWHLESAGHPMHLGALALFAPDPADPAPGSAPGADRPPPAHALLALLATRAAGVRRLRSRVRDVLLPVGGAVWLPDPDFDVTRHVHRIRLPGAAPLADEAVAVAGELMERPLERGRPPWEMYLLTGRPDGTFGVLVKLHHALADGMRAVAIGSAIFDEIADPRGVRARAAARLRGGTEAAGRPWFGDPARLVGVARGRIDDLGRAVGVGASVVLASRFDPRGRPPSLAAGTSGTRRLGTAVLDAADIRRVRRASGGTTNDVLLAVVAGGLRRWLAGRGEPLPADGPRALVPVSRRRPGDPAGPGNELSAYLLDLPVAEPDPYTRLDLVRRAMDRNKEAGPLRGAGALAVLADQLPPIAHRFGAPLAGGAARMLFDLVVTSVPLPRSELSIGGCPLRSLYPMAPLARGHSLAVALTSYGGRIHVGLVADGEAVPDVARLASATEEELAELTAKTPAASATGPGTPSPA